jgi:hypothetical protein
MLWVQIAWDVKILNKFFKNKNPSWNKKLMHAWKCKIQPSSAKLANFVFHYNLEYTVFGTFGVPTASIYISNLMYTTGLLQLSCSSLPKTTKSRFGCPWCLGIKSCQ